MKEDKSIVILLTGTVRPKVKNITISDPEYRLNEYVKSVRWYLQKTSYKIVFVENSGCDNFPINLNGEDLSRLEYISFKESDNNGGAGYNEWLILKKAKEKSEFIKDADIIVKGTGRLILKNIKQIVKQALGCNKSFFIGDYANDFKSMTTTFFVFSPDLFEDILSIQNKILDFYVEIAIMNFVHKQVKRAPESILFFNDPLLISGRSGHYGNIYDTPWYKVPLRYIYRICNTFIIISLYDNP